MEGQNSDDWLPPGWTVELRVRKNGKRDKYYFCPLRGLKFNSKVEVCRYLDSAQSKVSIQRISDNVVVEKGFAEELPAGWMKKTRITTKGDTIRRDLLYIDPVSGYAFRSVKDAERYLESGEIGKNAFKPKDNDSSVMELKDGKFSSASITMKPTLSVSLGQSSETIDGTENVQAQNPQCKNNHKKEINLPRRASKRLAGIKVNTLPELVTKNQARQDAVKQSGEKETIINADKSANSLLNDLAKQFNAPEGSETKCKSDANSTENMVNLAPEEVRVGVFENADTVAAKLDYNLGVPLKELLTDPCIAFAIQTLTGVTFETSKDTQISSELKSSQHCETSTTAEEHDKKIKALGVDSAGCNVLSSQKTFAIPQEHAAVGVAHIADMANENAGSSSERTHDISWMDPCIEFAIKTLTGTIPVDLDENPKTCFQQQLSSSNNQHGEMALSSVNLCQSDYNCSQYFGTQKPMFNQSCVDPALQHPGNIGRGNSTGARFPHW